MKLISLLSCCFFMHILYAANTIVVLVPGMGQGVISVAEAYQFGREGKSFGGNKMLKMVQTSSSVSLLKNKNDDALSISSAIATGVRPYPGRCGVDMQGIPYQNICEIAVEKKMKCGLISTGKIDSPAIMAMYDHNRSLIDNTKTELLKAKFDLFIAAGYEPPADFTGKVIRNRDEYKDISIPMRGILPNKGLKLRGIDGTKADPAEPTLSELTIAAMNALANKAGFLLVIDAAGIDKAIATKDAGLWAGEMLGIDKAIFNAEKWVETHGGWTENNLLIIGLNEKGITSIQTRAIGTTPIVKFFSTENINSMTPIYCRGKIFESIKANCLNDHIYKKDSKVITPEKLFFAIADIL